VGVCFDRGDQCGHACQQCAGANGMCLWNGSPAVLTEGPNKHEAGQVCTTQRLSQHSGLPQVTCTCASSAAHATTALMCACSGTLLLAVVRHETCTSRR
jgi:hypothetical protein